MAERYVDKKGSLTTLAKLFGIGGTAKKIKDRDKKNTESVKKIKIK